MKIVGKRDSHPCLITLDESTLVGSIGGLPLKSEFICLYNCRGLVRGRHTVTPKKIET